MKPFFIKAVIFVCSVLISPLPLSSFAKQVDVKIPVKEHQNIEIIAKQGVFIVSGWNENFVSLNGQANQDIEYENENSRLLLKLNSADPLASDDSLIIKIPSNRKVNVISDNADFSFIGLNPRLTSNTQAKNTNTKNVDSDISVASIDGNVNIKSSSGDFSINTVNGDIEILDSKGNANIRSISGNQTVKADLRNVRSSNVSGHSSYRLRTLEKLNLNNINGDSSIESSVSQGASIQVQSVKGNVQLFVPETTSARFTLQSHQGGNISNSLDGEFDTSNDSGAQSFTLADANANVTIDTMEGSITVAAKNPTMTEYSDENYDWSSVDTSILNFAFVNPNYDIFDYKEIFIKQPMIHFDPRWEKKYGKKKTRLYRERIAADYAKILKDAVSDKFSKAKDSHFTIVDQRKENALVIIPKVFELYIDNPEAVEIREMLIATPAGNARIDLVIFSPRDNSILGLFMDKRSTARPEGIATFKPRTMNSRAFSRLFNDWIEDIAKVLTK